MHASIYTKDQFVTLLRIYADNINYYSFITTLTRQIQKTEPIGILPIGGKKGGAMGLQPHLSSQQDFNFFQYKYYLVRQLIDQPQLIQSPSSTNGITKLRTKINYLTTVHGLYSMEFHSKFQIITSPTKVQLCFEYNPSYDTYKLHDKMITNQKNKTVRFHNNHL